MPWLREVRLHAAYACDRPSGHQRQRGCWLRRSAAAALPVLIGGRMREGLDRRSRTSLTAALCTPSRPSSRNATRLEHRDVLQRIALDGDDVRGLAGLDVPISFSSRSSSAPRTVAERMASIGDMP